jgi:hypothetical protein
MLCRNRLRGFSRLDKQHRRFGKIPSFFCHYFLKEEGVNLPEKLDFRKDWGGIFAFACDNLPK